MPLDKTIYIAKSVDADGNAAYTDENYAVWHELIARQRSIIQNRACDEYIQGLQLLNLPENRIPQCHEVSKVLLATTGWQLEPVPALISFEDFFTLLANRRFPAATFIRTKEELNYVKEPDIFHEIFGHCPMLTNPAYAEFTHTYGKIGLNASVQDRILLARLFWFTIEFGLVNTADGIRAYGGGILSSISETKYSVESNDAIRKPFDVLQALRTSYHIDAIQPIYYVINNFDQLYQLADIDLMSLVKEAHLEGDAPTHPC